MYVYMYVYMYYIVGKGEYIKAISFHLLSHDCNRTRSRRHHRTFAMGSLLLPESG